MTNEETTAHHGIHSLLNIMRQLRDPDGGCPWDLRQNFHTIAPHTIEETYELVDAIAAEDFVQIRDELGDVLFQVVFYAQMASEQSLFTFEDVVDGIAGKLLRRHPHIFAETGGRRVSEKEVKDRWEQIKGEERQQKNQLGALDDVPRALPALSRSQKLQKRAARVGFDWVHSCTCACVYARLNFSSYLSGTHMQWRATLARVVLGDTFLANRSF